MSAAPRAPGPRVTALSGGVGGAKLALGLSRILDPDELAIVANTGDDFVHLGLTVCPDIDTLTYVLAGLDDPERGWGRRDETWHFMDALAELGGETWFRLGDRDLAVHVERTRRLALGEPLGAITAAIARRLGVRHAILPMSDHPVRTVVLTEGGEMAFQDYFVRARCRPRATGFRYDGAEAARPNGAALEVLHSPRLEAVVVCPSNPFVSIDPILALPGLREALAACGAPVIAVSPVVAGAALKGPTAKIMGELGLEVSAMAVARHYGGLLDGFVVDHRDRDLVAHISAMGIACTATETVMKNERDKTALAERVLGLAAELSAAGARTATAI